MLRENFYLSGKCKMERLAVLMQDHQNSRGLVNLLLKISAGIVILPNANLSRNQGVI